MDFTIEFYETQAGRCPVREFLDELKNSDPGDFAVVVAGLAKLRNSQYHREPLSKALGDGLFELVMWASSIPACCGFSCRVAGSWRCMASATKARPFRPATWRRRGNVWAIGGKERHDEEDQF